MKFGAVLPIWQLTMSEAETLALKAEEVGLDGVFVPDHILAKPATTQHYGANWPDPFSLLAFLALGLPFAERGRMSDDYIRAIKAAWAADVPEYSGRYLSFAGAHFAPRPTQQPHPPIWVGGAPGSLSAPAVRRCAELGDAWHPLALGLDEIEKGLGTLRELAARFGRGKGPGLAPRNMLEFSDKPKGSGRSAFQGSPDEIASDVRRVKS